MKIKHLIAGMFLASALVIPVSAHHSFAMFDQSITTTLDATVTKFKWTNPHAWVEVTVLDDTGKKQTWAVEMTSPNNLMREGFKRRTFRPGDKVDLVINPLRSGKSGGAFVGAKLADGTVLGIVSSEK